MPAKGFVSITVSEEVHEALKRFADNTKRSVPKAIEYLMEVAKNNPTKKEAKSNG